MSVPTTHVSWANWASVLVAAALAVVAGATAYVNSQASAQVAPLDKRVAVLEAQRTSDQDARKEDRERIKRIEQKLDRAPWK